MPRKLHSRTWEKDSATLAASSVTYDISSRTKLTAQSLKLQRQSGFTAIKCRNAMLGGR